MSALSRFLTPASRRSYSSYFSSKSGGGRYFNSAKPVSKAPTPPTTTTTGAASAKDTAANVAEIQKQDAVVKAVGDAQTATVSASSSSVSSSASSAASSSSTPSTSASSSVSPSDSAPTPGAALSSFLSDLTAPVLQHPTLSAKELKLHQFFAMHRPLLLLSQPSSILRPVPAGAPLFMSTSAPLDQQAQLHRAKNLEALGLPAGMGPVGLDAPVDPFLDPDAEAARQLTRALTMNKAAAALAWENTLRQLGLDVSKDADRVNLPQQFARDWEEILADSTKRKRRKKMKKHKLKKRRRATRHERLKLK